MYDLYKKNIRFVLDVRRKNIRFYVLEESMRLGIGRHMRFVKGSGLFEKEATCLKSGSSTCNKDLILGTVLLGFGDVILVGYSSRYYQIPAVWLFSYFSCKISLSFGIQAV